MISSFRGQYSWASNFHPAPFYVQGQKFLTSEHYFVACKTTDASWCRRIMAAETASIAKKLGRQCPIRPNWPEIRVQVMAQALWYKYTQHPDLQQKLVDTHPQLLVEGNYWHDNFWGDCSCDRCKTKEGRNVLGVLLMAHRDIYYTVRVINNA